VYGMEVYGMEVYGVKMCRPNRQQPQA